MRVNGKCVVDAPKTSPTLTLPLAGQDSINIAIQIEVLSWVIPFND